MGGRLRRRGPADRAHRLGAAGQDDVPDRKRLFESIWTVEGAAVHDAARVCASVAGQAGVEAPAPSDPLRPTGNADVVAVNALFNRMVAYVDRIG